MSKNQVRISATPEAVFDVLDDAGAYARWVMGTRRVRRVDDSWPAVGSGFHHAIGTAAGELHDSSTVRARERPSRLVLEVRFRPTGVALVELLVETDGSGSTVVLSETPIDGPISRLPHVVTDPLLHLRNGISLQRLRHEVERRKNDAPQSATRGGTHSP